MMVISGEFLGILGHCGTILDQHLCSLNIRQSLVRFHIIVSSAFLISNEIRIQNDIAIIAHQVNSD